MVYLLTPSNVLLPTAEPVFSDAIIYFTTDGPSPTRASPRYTAPFVVASTKIVKAVAAANTGYASGEIASATLRLSSSRVTPSRLRQTVELTAQGATANATI